jgi:hypothetical protein
MTTTDRINTFLRSEAALLTLLTMALISQTPHTAVLFHRLSPQMSGIANIAAWLHAIAYAIALEFATLVFVVRGQRSLAWLFAIVSIGVNLLYYAIGEWTFLYITSALLVSVALPSSIAFYSHGIAQTAHATSAEPDAETTATDTAIAAQTDVQLAPEPAQPAAIIATQTDAKPAQPARKTQHKTARKPAQKMNADQRRLHIIEAGYTDASTIATQFNISLRTAQADLAAVRSATMQTNGVHHG